MNVFKRSLAMMLVLCMLFSVMPVAALADDSAQDITGASEEISADENYDAAVIGDEPLADEESEMNEPQTDEPEVDEPKTDEPEADEPKTDEPETDEPKTDEPEADEPETDEPEADEPETDEPEADESETDETVTEESKTEESDELITSTDTVQEETDNDALNAIVEEEIEALANFEPTSVSLSYADTYHILHLDCGRKYFTADWIKALINEMAAAGFTHLELAFGNDGLRFLLDDMSVGSYTDDQVTAAIQAGNKAYYDFGTNELTQSEMDAIIAHANDKGIKIIPLLNNPGHMDAIVSAATSLTGSSAGYNGSGSTVNLENTDAVSFVKGLVEKYIAYFDGKGCNEFNMGADEYANDVYSTGSMGFGALVSAGKYQLFVNYVNEMADLIKSYGMVPIAFNDGIYFNQNTSYNFDTQIMVAFWTSGWTGYQSASASDMASKGHKMINVNGDYYYVLGKSDQWDSNGYTYAANWDNSAFMGSTVSNPAGSMFCIWCDYPGAETETQIAANTRLVLRAMAAEMQGKDATSISDEVISGGFNADGTIAEDCNNVTVKDETSRVEVTGCELTSVTVLEAEAPVIENASNVKAWDITPYVGTEKHTTSAIVKVPVPTEWDTSRLGAFLVEADGTVTLITGTYADGYYTFKMDHFSVGGIYETAPAAEGDTDEYDQLIELNIGEDKTVLIEGVDLTGQTFTPDPAGIASVTTEAYSVEGDKTLVEVESITDIISGAKYLITTPNGAILTANAGNYNENNNLLALEKGYADVNNPNVWTITASGTGYTISSGANRYLTFDTNTASVTSTPTNIRINGDGSFTFHANGDYLNNFGGADQAAGGWSEYDYNAVWYLYRIDGSDAASGTNVTFTGEAKGETYVTINDTVYKIIVHGTVPITIKYQTEDGTLIKTETVNVADNATTHTVSNFNYNGKFYTVDNTTLTITPATVTEYTVTVTEVEEDLSQVSPLTIEYFITNQRVPIDGETQMSLAADDVYGEDGVVFAELVPASDNAENPKVLWRGWLLPDGYHQEGDETSLDMCTDTNGTRIQKIRYWNGSWQYFNGTDWISIKDTDQVVAYYVQMTQITDEVTTNVTDWGETYSDWEKNNNSGHWFWGGYVENGSKFVFMDFAVVYEDGTQTPNTFPQDDTWFFHFDGCSATNPRVLKPIVFTETSDYEIWKVTVTDGTSDGYGNATTFTSNYDNTTETIVWSEDMGGTPRIENLTYTANRSGKLIRIYIRAVETEDTLNVVYYDEKFGDTLYTYNISVESGKNFTNDIVGATEFAENTARIDVSNASIVNALGKTQNFQTDLTQVPEAVGKYNSELYEYTGSVISDDGKTLYLYYNINQEALSPNFVADFGLPLTFKLEDVVNEGMDTVLGVTVNQNTRYGTLSYTDPTDNTKNGTFTYTPTSILQNIDVLTIDITFDEKDGPKTVTTNVGVTPATTVYYGEKFIEFSNGWTTEGTYQSVGNQKTEVLGNSTYYGYDDAYANTIGASDGTARKSVTIGNSATFTFTGTGIQVFANSTPNSGYASVMVKNQDTGAVVKVTMVDTVVSGTTGTETTGGQIGQNLAGLPIVSLVDLTGLEHATYDVTISKVMDSDPVYIDGIRVFETVEDQSHFVADKEDNPDFYEVRDLVMKAIGIAPSESKDYKTMYDQVYKSTVEVGASAVITNANAAFGDHAAAVSAPDAVEGLYEYTFDTYYKHDGKIYRCIRDASNASEAGQTSIYLEKLPSADDVHFIEDTSDSNVDTAVDPTTVDGVYKYTFDTYYNYGGKVYRCIRDASNASEAGQTTIYLDKRPSEDAVHFMLDNAFSRQDLLDNGPKNELYLFQGDTLTMNVSTNRVIQLGLKAPEGSASFTLNGENKTLSTTVDMFYKIAEKGGTTHTITVENTGEKILSVTLLKVCDDPNFAFVPLTEANIKDILADAGITETPVEPEQPTYTMVELKGTDVLIDGTVFDYTGEPIEPAITVNVGGTQLVEGKDYSVTYTNNVEPGTATVTVRGIATASETLGYTGEVSINYTINAPVTPEEPEIPEETTKPEKPSQTKATAELKIELVDYAGKKIGTAKLSAKGISGDTCFFAADEILKAAKAKLSGKYVIVDESAISGVETVYGENSTVTVRVGKVATLKITYVNLFGKKVGTATITDVQTAGGYCGISAFRINAQAPSGRRGMWLLPAVIPYGNTVSIIVPVI